MNHLFLALTTSLFFISCSSNEADKATHEKTVKTEIRTTQLFTLHADESVVNWERELDQKPTKQKVKIFGQMVDVELGAVNLKSSGTAEATEGNLVLINHELSTLSLTFDMTTFKFASEKGNGLFDTKSYPSSTLDIYEFVKEADSYTAKGRLTIQEVANEIVLQITYSQTDKIATLQAETVINTLDWPIRTQVQSKDVNKDEVKVILNLSFTESEVKEEEIELNEE